MCSARPATCAYTVRCALRRLVAVVDVELAGLRVEVGDHPARLQRRRVAARVDDVPGDDRVGLGERAVGGLLVARLPRRAGEVVGLAVLVVADQRRVGVERLAGVDDRGQRLVVDVDQRQRVARDVLVGRDHERDLLALEADLVAREHGLRVVGDRRHPGQAERLEVLGGDHRGDAGQRERRRGVDRVDLGVRVGTAQDRAVHHPGQADVVQVGALAADEARVLLALEAAEADRPLGPGSEGSRGGHRSGLLSSSRLRARPPSEPRRRCSCSPCSGRSRRRWRCGSRARSGSGSRRAAPAWSSASPACRSRSAARASRGSPCWTGSSLPSTSSDSTVRISWPSHIAASVVQDLTGWPSISTTQAPQLEVSQPQWVPVRPGRVADEVHEQRARLDVAGDRPGR